MPRKSKVPCQHPGCPELVEAGAKHCERHKSLYPVRSASSRGYGSRWQRFRKRFLAAHPLCEECMKQGRYTKATDIDHIKAHRGDPELFWDLENMMALCHSCHSKKTAREDLHPVYSY